MKLLSTQYSFILGIYAPMGRRGALEIKVLLPKNETQSKSQKVSFILNKISCVNIICSIRLGLT